MCNSVASLSLIVTFPYIKHYLTVFVVILVLRVIVVILDVYSISTVLFRVSCPHLCSNSCIPSVLYLFHNSVITVVFSHVLLLVIICTILTKT